MMKYEPRASQFERDCCSYAILADLKHAEACIKARDEEIERLHNLLVAKIREYNDLLPEVN